MMYQGIMPPLVTPLGADRSTVCERSVERLVESLQPHVSGYITALSSGEGWKLDDNQWQDIARVTKKYAGEMPVFVGILRPATDDVVRLARRAETLGIDGLAITSPFGKRVTQDEILKHYRMVASATDLPLLVYNESDISMNITTFEVLVEIAALTSVVAMKESSGSLALLHMLLDAGLDLAIFQGRENLCLESKGVAGYAMALANVEPQMCLNIWSEPTPERQMEVSEFCSRSGLFEADWFAWIKTMLKARGIIANSAVV